MNYIRTSHYPPPEEFLDLCDEYGFFVECEAPLCWVHSEANPVSSGICCEEWDKNLIGILIGYSRAIVFNNDIGLFCGFSN